jgi:hypothetical protein
MKKIFFFLVLLSSLFALSSCQFLNVPSFRLYVGYDLTPSNKIIPNDLALPKVPGTP